jgi:hypothetical protein
MKESRLLQQQQQQLEERTVLWSLAMALLGPPVM